jgi:hypothetical protein
MLDRQHDEVVTVHYATADGTAHAGTDYTAVNGTATFQPNHQSVTFQVPILDNALHDGSRAFSVQLSSPSDNADLGTPFGATVTIADDEALVPSVVSDVEFIDIRNRIGTVLVRFSKPLSFLGIAGDFQLLSRAARGAGAARDVKLRSVGFNVEQNALILVPKTPLKLGTIYQLLLNARNSIVDTDGVLLDGDGDGVAGGSYGTYFARGKRINYVDHDGDIVRFRLRGAGMMQLWRGNDWDGRWLDISGPSPSSMLIGKVTSRSGSDGIATLDQITGVGTMRSNLSPAIVVTQIS